MLFIPLINVYVRYEGTSESSRPHQKFHKRKNQCICPPMFKLCYPFAQEGHTLSLQILLNSMNDFISTMKMATRQMGFQFVLCGRARCPGATARQLEASSPFLFNCFKYLSFPGW